LPGERVLRDQCVYGGDYLEKGVKIYIIARGGEKDPIREGKESRSNPLVTKARRITRKKKKKCGRSEVPKKGRTLANKPARKKKDKQKKKIKLMVNGETKK